MSAARFGESFSPIPESRVHILDKETEMPSYVDFGRSVRKLLRSSVEGVDYNQRENWPECPKNLKNIEDLLESAKIAVADHWQKTSAEILGQKFSEWLSQIPDDKKNQPIRRLLQNPESLDEKIKIYQLGELEGLRTALPDAWRTLVMLSSERQLATLSLLRYWIKEGLTDSDAQNMGTSKPELEIMLDAGGILGKYADHAYVKQIEMADQPGGTAKSRLSSEPGGEFVYEDKSSGQMIRRAYAEVFPGEWPRIIRGLGFVQEKVQKLLAESKLPESYALLPDYLKTLIDLYSSTETSPEKLKAMHDEVDRQMTALARAGCPMMFLVGATSGVTGDAEKVDVDLRLGIITEGLKAFDKEIDAHTQIAQKMVDQNRQALDKKDFKVPRLILNDQPLAFGANLQYFTPAESGEVSMVSHVNVNNEVARVNHPPLIKRLFPEKAKTLSLPEHMRAINDDTSRHEISHNVMSTEDEAVEGRIGTGNPADVLEELKAETVSMILSRERQKQLPKEKRADFAQEQFFTKVIVVADYLANKSKDPKGDGYKYYYAGLAMLDKLLSSGLLVADGDGYRITDPQQGMTVMSQMGEDILKRFYTNPEATPDHVKEYLQALKKREQDPEIKKFISKLKG